MPLVVLRYKDPSVLPWIYSTGPDGTVPDEIRDGGWSLDLDADPLEVQAAIQEAQANAVAQAEVDRSAVRFASDPAPEQPADPPTDPSPEPSPSPSPNPPAEPVTTEEN